MTRLRAARSDRPGRIGGGVTTGVATGALAVLSAGSLATLGLLGAGELSGLGTGGLGAPSAVQPPRPVVISADPTGTGEGESTGGGSGGGDRPGSPSGGSGATGGGGLFTPVPIGSGPNLAGGPGRTPPQPPAPAAPTEPTAPPVPDAPAPAPAPPPVPVPVSPPEVALPLPSVSLPVAARGKPFKAAVGKQPSRPAQRLFAAAARRSEALPARSTVMLFTADGGTGESRKHRRTDVSAGGAARESRPQRAGRPAAPIPVTLLVERLPSVLPVEPALPAPVLPPGHGGTPPGHGGTPPGLAGL